MKLNLGCGSQMLPGYCEWAQNDIVVQIEMVLKVVNRAAPTVC